MLINVLYRLSTGYFLFGMVMLSTSQVNSVGLLEFLLGFPAPPTPPSFFFGGWRPIPGPIVRPAVLSNPQFGQTTPLPPFLGVQADGNRFINQRPPIPSLIRFVPNVVSSQIIDERPLRTTFTDFSSPQSNNNFMESPNPSPRPLQILNNNKITFENNGFQTTNSENLQVFSRIKPEILENAIFRFDNKLN